MTVKSSQVSFIVILLYEETYSGMKWSQDHSATYLNVNTNL